MKITRIALTGIAFLGGLFFGASTAAADSQSVGTVSDVTIERCEETGGRLGWKQDAEGYTVAYCNGGLYNGQLIAW